MKIINKLNNVAALATLAFTLSKYCQIESTGVLLFVLIVNSIILSRAILFTRFDNPFRWLAEKPIRFYWLAIILSSSIIIPLGIKNKIGYSSDVLVEAHGLLFDLIVFGILLTSYEAIKNALQKDEDDKSAIDRYNEEIDDFRDWNSQEAKIRVRGNIRRSNKLGNTKFDLFSINLSLIELRKVRLTGSSLTDTIFSGCNLENSYFDDTTSTSAKFIGKNTFLLNANFQRAELQYVEFTEAYLNGADFKNSRLSSIDFRRADLRNTKWNNAYFYDPNLAGACVDENFLEELRVSNIKGHRIYEWYTIIKQPVLQYPGKFEYRLKPNPLNSRDMKIYNFTIDDVRNR